jgi:hypothetical protein
LLLKLRCSTRWPEQQFQPRDPIESWTLLCLHQELRSRLVLRLPLPPPASQLRKPAHAKRSTDRLQSWAAVLPCGLRDLRLLAKDQLEGRVQVNRVRVKHLLQEYLPLVHTNHRYQPVAYAAVAHETRAAWPQILVAPKLPVQEFRAAGK